MKNGVKFDTYLKQKLSNQSLHVAFKEAAMHLKLAHLIEDLRTKLDLTQAQLAKKSGVSQPMIARLEQGDQERIPTLSTVNKIFGALGHEKEL